MKETTQPARRARLGILLAVGLLVGLVAAVPAVATHGGSTSPELNVVGQLDAPGMGVLFGTENITDVWAAQSSSDGRDYAYLGTFDDLACTFDWTGTHIVDITDPTAPAQVAFIADKPATRTNDVKVEHIETKHFNGEILVATNEACGSQFVPRLTSNGVSGNAGRGGFSIWDVTDPTKPHALKQNFLPNNGIHNTYIWQDGDNAYLIAVDDVALDDVIVVDITKPQSPKVIARTGAPDWATLDFSEIAFPNIFLHDVWVQDGIAYLSYWDAGLVLLDVSDPANPVFLGDSTYAAVDPLSGEAPEGNAHNAIPNADGTLTWLSDEDFGAGQLTKFDFDSTPYGAGVALFGPVVSSPLSWPLEYTGGEGCMTGEFSDQVIVNNAGQVALIDRGSCFFSEKAANAEALGYDAYVVANNAGDGLINMSAGTNDVITIPGFFVGQSTGDIMKANQGASVDVDGVFDGYGYLRLLDTSTPGAIVELDQFATEGVFANPPIPGDRTIHNIDLEGNTAYISWYAEGMRVVEWDGVDLKETAHYVDPAGSNFWGVYLYEHSDGKTYILGSDRVTGLWIFDTP